MVFTLKESVGTLPTSGSPTVSTAWIQHDAGQKDAKIELTTDVAGDVLVQYSYDGSSVVSSDTFPVDANNWHKILKLKTRYIRVSFTLDAAAPDATYFRMDYLHSDTLERDNNSELNFADDSIQIYGTDLTGNANPVKVDSNGWVNVDIARTVSSSDANLDIPISTLETTLNAIETNTSGLVDTANLDIPQSEIKTVVQNVDSNVQVLSDKFRTGAEQALDPADPSNILVQTLVYGLHEGHGTGVDDQHPIAVNENGHLFATVETNGVALDVVNSNLDIPISTLETTLNAIETNTSSLGDTANLDIPQSEIKTAVQNVDSNIQVLNTSINSQSALLIDNSNLNVPLSDVYTIIDSVGSNNDAANADLAARISAVDANVQVLQTKVESLDANLAIYNAAATTVYSNSITQFGQILVSGPVTQGRILSLSAATASSLQTVIGIYDSSAIAPDENSLPIHTLYLDNSTTTVTQSLFPGVRFNNGIAVRAQTVSGQFSLVGSNAAVSADTVVMSITYTTE